MSEKDGYIIRCPYCGKPYNRSIVAESITNCDKCKTKFYTYLKDGVMIIVDLTHTSEVREGRIQEYADKLNILNSK